MYRSSRTLEAEEEATALDTEFMSNLSWTNLARKVNKRRRERVSFKEREIERDLSDFK